MPVYRQDPDSLFPQVLVTPKYYLIHVQRYGMYFIANVQTEVATPPCDALVNMGRSFLWCCGWQVTPLLVTEFLHRVVDVFRDYFNEVTELRLTVSISSDFSLRKFWSRRNGFAPPAGQRGEHQGEFHYRVPAHGRNDGQRNTNDN